MNNNYANNIDYKKSTSNYILVMSEVILWSLKEQPMKSLPTTKA